MNHRARSSPLLRRFVAFALVVLLIHATFLRARKHKRLGDSVAPQPPSPQEDSSAESADEVLHRKRRFYPKKLFHYLDRVPTVLPTRSTDGVCLGCYRLVSFHPRVYLFDQVLTESEARALIELGEPLLSRSGVFAKQSVQRSVRSSFGARIPNGNATVDSVNRRLLYIVNHFSDDKRTREFRAGHAERLELLRYEGAQKYAGHVDNFGGIDGPLAHARRRKLKKLRALPAESDVAKKLRGSLNGPLLDRGATMIVFLNNVTEGGGATTFPYAEVPFEAADASLTDEANATTVGRWKRMLSGFRTNKDDPCAPRSSASLPPFLRVTPRVGRMVLFYDLYENGVADPFALHAGCPPTLRTDVGLRNLSSTFHVNNDPASRETAHVKYVVTKWFMIPIVPETANAGFG